MTINNIICFAKDWGENPTSNHHVMVELSKTHRVLWLNSVATRTPRLASRRDLGKIVDKLTSFARGPRRINDNLFVFTPLVLPFPHSAGARRLNRYILRANIRALRWRLGMDRFQLWSFLPNVADYIGSLGESLIVYYCVDEWSGFHYIDDRTREEEIALCSRADIVFAVSQPLLERKGALNPHTHYAPHGVNHALFSRALDEETEVPGDVARLPGPMLGFIGTVHDWIDFDLIAFLAERHPDWSIVFVGDRHCDVSRFDEQPNVHFLGRRAHDELPAYCKRFDVGLIPYHIDERVHFANPLKLREYLCAGLPVVSTPIPECIHYGDRCAIADTHEAFEAAVIAALGDGSREARRERSASMSSETWEEKVAAVCARVQAALARKLGN